MSQLWDRKRFLCNYCKQSREKLHGVQEALSKHGGNANERSVF
jgi:hypothetical protein